MTAILIILPALYFYIYEFHRVRWDWMSEGGRIMASLFQAVTPRTAGFNTIDLNMMSDVSKMIIIVLMLIGASPGSTAGGMKTTTVAVLISSAFPCLKKRGSRGVSPPPFGRCGSQRIRRAFNVCCIVYAWQHCDLPA